jgi:hypothetical protein
VTIGALADNSLSGPNKEAVASDSPALRMSSRMGSIAAKLDRNGQSLLQIRKFVGQSLDDAGTITLATDEQSFPSIQLRKGAKQRLIELEK